jgi:hypothetical protein
VSGDKVSKFQFQGFKVSRHWRHVLGVRHLAIEGLGFKPAPFASSASSAFKEEFHNLIGALPVLGIQSAIWPPQFRDTYAPRAYNGQ